jgi:hypothetical protein
MNSFIDWLQSVGKIREFLRAAARRPANSCSKELLKLAKDFYAGHNHRPRLVELLTQLR